MPVKAIADIIKEHDTRLWRILDHHVEQARNNADFSSVKQVGVDETFSKRGHNYVTVFVDLEGPKTVFATKGKDASTLSRFKEDLVAHGGDANAVEEVCCDMSPAFMSDTEQYFSEAHITFDKSHVFN